MGRTKTYVSSSLYNLAGDPRGKPTFKRTAIAGAIVRGSGIPEDVRNSYITGPAMNTRAFGRWARKSGYDDVVGLEPAQFKYSKPFTKELLADAFALRLDEDVEILSAELGAADIGYWAEKYVIDVYMKNNPNMIKENIIWDYTYDKTSNTLLVKIEGVEYPATVENYDPGKRYIYSLFRINTAKDPVETIEGNWQTIDGYTVQEPDLSKWTYVSGTVPASKSVSLSTKTTTTKTIDGVKGTPVTTTTYRNESVVVGADEYKQTVYLGSAYTNTPDLENDNRKLQRDYGYTIETETSYDWGVGTAIVNDQEVFVDTEIKIEKQKIVPYKKIKIGRAIVTARRYGDFKFLIYKEGSGIAALDTLFEQGPSEEEWFPFIPIRIDNKFLEEHDPVFYKKTEKAYKKAFGRKAKLKDLVEKLKDNESLKDIDFAHIMFGVPLNTRNPWGLRYIFTFLSLAQESFLSTKNEHTQFQKDMEDYLAYAVAMQEWNESQDTEYSINKPLPETVKKPVKPVRSFELKSSNEFMHFRHVIEFSFLYKETGPGRLIRDKKIAKAGDIWASFVDASGKLVLEDKRYKLRDKKNISSFIQESNTTIVIVHQVTNNRWEKITLCDAKHLNYAYGDHAITTYAADALIPTKETVNGEEVEIYEESGFIFPLNERMFKEMGIVDSSELNNCTAYLILNSYVKVKKKWYQTGIFAVIVVIVLIVVSYFFPPAGTSAGGILGTNATVGSAILGAGASAAAIAIVGAIANALAGMIIGALLSKVATKLFGNSVLGSVFAAVAMIMVGQYQAAASSGSQTSLSSVFSSLMDPQNLIQLTMSGVNGISQYIGETTKDLITKTQDMVNAYKAESQRILDMYVDQFGAGTVIDPLMFTAAGRGVVESLDSFISRTLLTGPDIASMSNDMLSNFANLTLSTELPL